MQQWQAQTSKPPSPRARPVAVVSKCADEKQDSAYPSSAIIQGRHDVQRREERTRRCGHKQERVFCSAAGAFFDAHTITRQQHHALRRPRSDCQRRANGRGGATRVRPPLSKRKPLSLSVCFSTVAPSREHVRKRDTGKPAPSGGKSSTSSLAGCFFFIPFVIFRPDEASEAVQYGIQIRRVLMR